MCSLHTVDTAPHRTPSPQSPAQDGLPGFLTEPSTCGPLAPSGGHPGFLASGPCCPRLSCGLSQLSSLSVWLTQGPWSVAPAVTAPGNDLGLSAHRCLHAVPGRTPACRPPMPTQTRLPKLAWPGSSFWALEAWDPFPNSVSSSHVQRGSRAGQLGRPGREGQAEPRCRSSTIRSTGTRKRGTRKRATRAAHPNGAGLTFCPRPVLGAAGLQAPPTWTQGPGWAPRTVIRGAHTHTHKEGQAARGMQCVRREIQKGPVGLAQGCRKRESATVLTPQDSQEELLRPASGSGRPSRELGHARAGTHGPVVQLGRAVFLGKGERVATVLSRNQRTSASHLSPERDLGAWPSPLQSLRGHLPPQTSCLSLMAPCGPCFRSEPLHRLLCDARRVTSPLPTSPGPAFLPL